MSVRVGKIIPSAITLLIALSIGLGACVPAAPAPTSAPQAQEEATKAEATPAPQAAEEKQPLTIGAVFNATGWMAAYDQPPRSAAMLAIDDINSKGGVMGRSSRAGITNVATKIRVIELNGRSEIGL